MRFLLLLCLLPLVLAGCDSSSREETEPDNCSSINTTTSSQIITIHDEVCSSVNITGDGNSISVEDSNDIILLSLNGSNNLVTIDPGATVETIDVNGNDNTLYIPDSLIFQLNDNGIGNQIFYTDPTP